MLPLVEALVGGLAPLAQRPRLRLGEVSKWMTSVVAMVWLTLVKAPRADVCWRTVTIYLRPLINPEKFDVPKVLTREVVDGLSAADVAKRIPEDFMNERLESDLLRTFQDFHSFLQTGQHAPPKKEAKLQYGRVISFREVRVIYGDDGKKRQVGGDGLIAPEDNATSPVRFCRSSYGKEKITKKMRVSFVAKECMQGEIAEFVSPTDG